MAELLYSFYGDDFTGSTDVLERLASGGVRAALFLQPPTAEDLQLVPGLQAIGIAGDSRSRTPEWMSAELPAVFVALRALGATVTQYKVCSTFDSSAERGSIGRAMEIGLEVFGSAFVPVVVGAPHLRRFVWQGMLFASDARGEVNRIDRHPMSRHPVTPMREPRLRRHLGAQTTLRIGEVGVSELDTCGAALNRELAAGCQVVVFDTVTAEDVASVGWVLWATAQRKPLFGVGSSGMTAALIAAWREGGAIAEAAGELPDQGVCEGPGEPLLVVSGSCSAATERQLRWALANGFDGMPVEPAALLDAERGSEVRAGIVDAVVAALAVGRSPLVYTAMGTPVGPSQGDSLGEALGLVLREVLAKAEVRRVLLCGGDTSSHAVQQLGLRALTWSADLQVGAPLCRAHGAAPGNGLELVLKGGQVGTEDFFAVVRDARVTAGEPAIRREPVQPDGADRG